MVLLPPGHELAALEGRRPCRSTGREAYIAEACRICRMRREGVAAAAGERRAREGGRAAMAERQELHGAGRGSRVQALTVH